MHEFAGAPAAPANRPVLGLFSSSHMSYQLDRTPETKEPTLTEMTAEAIRRLSGDPDGFYLMVEGGRIDHAHHEGRAGYALEETIERFNGFARAGRDLSNLPPVVWAAPFLSGGGYCSEATAFASFLEHVCRRELEPPYGVL